MRHSGVFLDRRKSVPPLPTYTEQHNHLNDRDNVYAIPFGVKTEFDRYQSFDVAIEMTISQD